MWAARAGGRVLDRVYTAKALAGLLAIAEDGRWQENDDVVFGTPAVSRRSSRRAGCRTSSG